MDSTGIHLLISAFNHARADGWRFEVDPDLSRPVEQLFKLTDVERTTAATGSTTNRGRGKSVVA